jgi:hypothetical protein
LVNVIASSLKTRFGAPVTLVIWAPNSTRPAQMPNSTPVCLRAGPERTARNRRVKDARRSVTGPLSAASARYSRIGDSDFGVRLAVAKPRFLGRMATYKSRRIAPRIRWTERKPITTCVSFDETELRASYCAVYLDHTSIHHSQGVDKDKIIRSHLNRTPCREWLRSASAWEFLCANACAYHLAACQPRVHAPWGATHLAPPPRRTLRPQSPRV